MEFLVVPGLLETGNSFGFGRLDEPRAVKRSASCSSNKSQALGPTTVAVGRCGGFGP